MEKFYKFGFFILLIIVLLLGYLFSKVNPMKNNGQLSWADMYSDNSVDTGEFLVKTMGMEVENVINTENLNYNLIKAKNAIFPSAGIMQITEEWKKQGLTPHSTLYFTVTDYDTTHQKMIDNGATVLVPAQIKNDMRFGVYMIPGNLDIAIVQYGVKDNN